ncbi:unnamed protein product [Blepharisma stoltei]|uniref:Histone deacetylase interacting domain-containing protein n=1 Tax=Blepharisma stoltei TaxID=1481888 RepID=A0AAU9KF90_9CILI|nr:unnamed protein product [Blepharisma stoltei]
MQNRVESARKYLTLVRNKFKEHGDKYEEFLQVMKAFKEQRMDTEAVCKRVQELFKGHRVLLLEFNKLIPQNYRISIESRPHYNEAIDYMRRVKEETKHDPAIYEEFIRILKLYQGKEMSLDDVNNSVKKLMVDFPSLIDSFKAFLPNYYDDSSSEEKDEPAYSKPIKKRKEIAPVTTLSIEKLVIEEIGEPIGKNEVVFFGKLKKVLDLNSQPNTDYFLEFSQVFQLYTDCIITKVELLGVVEPLFQLTDFHKFLNLRSPGVRRYQKEENPELTQFVQHQLNDFYETLKVIATSRESNRRKHGWFFRPLSDFDTGKTKRNGHSYLQVQRPSIKRHRVFPYESKWISVPYGSEDFSFRNFRKNAFEDALFKCEDERYELDMTIECALATLKMLEAAENKMKSLPIDQQKTFQLDDKFMEKLRLRSIQSIYSEHASKIIETLKNNPSRALSVVISRIKSKIDAWKNISKPESDRTWDETVEKNFYKSLDHRSFYFKQNEKKMTNAKNYLTEAKSRSLNLAAKKAQLRKYIEDKTIDQNYDIIGGSRNQIFFNSFAGLSGAVYHKVLGNFVDDILEEFKELDKPERALTFNNGVEYATLPQFRLLLNHQPIINDALRILLYAADKTSLSGKEKLNKWIIVIFQEFFGLKLPYDITNHLVEDYFESIPEEEIIDIETAKNIINKWNTEENSEMIIEKDENPIEEVGQNPISLKKDQSFAAFIPLMKKHNVMYCPSTVYCFLRFFFVMYERLLKVKMVLSQEGKENPPIEVGEYKFSDEAQVEYLGFLKSVSLILKNTYDNAKFEDKCRILLGNDAYVLFTFDKLAIYTAKALHALAHDEVTIKSLPFFQRFNRNKLNEEVYMSDFLRSVPSHQLFRLHWNVDFRILCMTYIESPCEKLQEPAVKHMLKYAKDFTNEACETDLEDEIKIMHERLDVFYQNYGITQNDLANQLILMNGIKIGLNESSLKMHFIPEHEDYLFNAKYYKNHILLATEEETYICQDKNSYVQKITEIGLKKFQKWMESNQK